MEKKSKKGIIFLAFLVVSLIAIGTVLYLRKDLSNSNLTDNNNTEIKSNQNDSSQEDENIINIEIQSFYGHEPNLEFLTSSSDLIVSGMIDTSSFVSEVINTFIYTNMDIQITKVYKNTFTSAYSTSGNNNLSSLNINYRW